MNELELVTLDLDDTIIRVYRDYEEIGDRFATFLSNAYGVDYDEAYEKYYEVNRDVFHGELETDYMAIVMERLLTSFVADPSDDDIELAREFGKHAFKSRDEYAARGYMEGAREMVSACRFHADELHIITVGVPSIQRRKIRALRLEPVVDGVHIVKPNGKQETISHLVDDGGWNPNNTYHVGNSMSSDVIPAINAGVNSVYIPSNQWMKTPELPHSKDKVQIFDSVPRFNEYLRDVKGVPTC